MTQAFADPKLLAALSQVVVHLLKDKEVLEAATKLSEYVVEQPVVQTVLRAFILC
jgi:hypothetical protein